MPRPLSARPIRAATRPTASDSRPAPAPIFWLLLVFFVLEYVRPPIVTHFGLQLIFIAFLPLVWVMASDRRWSRIQTLQTAFFAVCALTVPFASNNFSAYLQTRAVYGHIVVALAITWVLASWSRFEWCIWFWVGIMVYQGVYSLAHGGHGTGGLLGDENDLALGCASAFACTFVGFRAFSGYRRVICGVLTVVLVMAIVASMSRGGFLALAATALYCVWTGRSRLQNLALGAVGALVMFALVPESYKAEMATMKDTRSGTADSRQFLWMAAFNMWKHHPILGVGAGNSNWRIGEYQPIGGRWDKPEYMERDYSMQELHSVYFQLLADLGLVGVIIVVAIIVDHFRTLRGLRRSAARDPTLSPEGRAEVELYCVSLAGAMVAYLTAGAFLSVLWYPYLWYFSAMAVALSRALPERLETRRAQSRS